MIQYIMSLTGVLDTQKLCRPAGAVSEFHTQPHLAIGAWCVLRVVVDLAGSISEPSPLAVLLPEVSQLQETGECERLFICTSKPW